MNPSKAYELATELMQQHNLDIQGWTFQFDSAVRRFGACNYSRRTIQLSRALTELNDTETVRNVLLHEIAHALAGRYAGHGSEWKQTARAIGCTGERCYNAETVNTPTARYAGTCPNCGRTIKRHKRNFGLACGNCCRQYNNNRHSSEYDFRWSRVAV